MSFASIYHVRTVPLRFFRSPSAEQSGSRRSSGNGAEKFRQAHGVFERTRSILFLTVLGVAIFFLLSVSAGAQTIHLIIAADLRGGDYASDSGASWRQGIACDAENIKSVFLAQVPFRNFRLTEICCEDVTPESILESVKSLEVEPNDTIVFYYSGHAAYDDQRDTGHYFQLMARDGKPTALARTDVLRAMSDKKPRLNVLLTDCCNVFADLPVREPSVPRGANRPADFSPLMRRLFLAPTGTVDITSSGIGEMSFVDSSGKNRGSCFTWPLVQLLRENENRRDLNWNSFLELLTESVREAFVECFPDGCQLQGMPKQTTQTVHAFELPSDGPGGLPRFGARVLSIRPSGVRLTEIAPNSPAQIAGLQIGDVIVRINGKVIENETDYSASVDRSPAEMLVEYQDQNKVRKTVTVILDQWSLGEYK